MRRRHVLAAGIALVAFTVGLVAIFLEDIDEAFASIGEE